MRASGGAWFALEDRELHVGVEEPFAPAAKAHPGLSVGEAELDALAARLEAAVERTPAIRRLGAHNVVLATGRA
jgi:hypothetical protein